MTERKIGALVRNKNRAFQAGISAEAGESLDQSDGHPSPAKPPVPTVEEIIDNEFEAKGAPIGVPFWVPLLGSVLILLSLTLVGFVQPLEHSKREFLLHILELFLAELGVALIVAYVIANGIDARVEARNERKRKQEERTAKLKAAREAEEQARHREWEANEAHAREQRLVEDVFVGVFGISHSPEYVRKVISTNLAESIVRTHVDMQYTIIPICDDDADKMKISRGRFVMLHQVCAWTFHNLSTNPTAEDFKVKVRLSVRHGEGIRTASKVTYARIGSDEYFEANLQPEDADDSAPEKKEYSWPRVIEGRGKLKVLLKAQLVKEMSDSEVWSSLYPTTEGMTLRVAAPQPFHVGVKSYAASPCENTVQRDGTGFGTWTIEGAILPCNSVVFYWRTPEDDGDPPGTPQAEGLERPIEASATHADVSSQQSMELPEE